jgi:hypothetical protein
MMMISGAPPFSFLATYAPRAASFGSTLLGGSATF